MHYRSLTCAKKLRFKLKKKCLLKLYQYNTWKKDRKQSNETAYKFLNKKVSLHFKLFW